MKKIYVLLVIMVFISCDDIIDEVDISNRSVELLAPTDTAVLTSTDVNFTWSTVADANEYVIQIAIPDFTNSLQIVTDSTINTTSFSTTLLAASSYEWRVKAKNPNYETGFSTRSLTTP
ncbi:hypothetical protein [Pseudofulvibacter geojedonensis]|uniref:Fibronectin type-III domain-containing protein n=1 Tax=Pseudofulvibacter geojedonensis TaxID=1123758 RepID=A0ABW3I2T1_9FLAO